MLKSIEIGTRGGWQRCSCAKQALDDQPLMVQKTPLGSELCKVRLRGYPASQLSRVFWVLRVYLLDMVFPPSLHVRTVISTLQLDRTCCRLRGSLRTPSEFPAVERSDSDQDSSALQRSPSAGVQRQPWLAQQLTLRRG